MAAAVDAARGTQEAQRPRERVAVIGAGMAGLVLALCLARTGRFEIVLIERDPPPPAIAPEDAFARWQRRGVARFRHAHLFHPRFRTLPRERLGEVLADLLAAGARELGVRDALPAAPGGRSDGAPAGAAGVRRARAASPRRGTGGDHDPARDRVAVGRELDTARQPAAVRGILVESGGQRSCFASSTVVDASGRASRVAQWLGEAGITPVCEQRTAIDLVYVT